MSQADITKGDRNTTSGSPLPSIRHFRSIEPAHCGSHKSTARSKRVSIAEGQDLVREPGVREAHTLRHRSALQSHSLPDKSTVTCSTFFFFMKSQGGWGKLWPLDHGTFPSWIKGKRTSRRAQMMRPKWQTHSPLWDAKEFRASEVKGHLKGNSLHNDILLKVKKKGVNSIDFSRQ